MRWLDGSLTEVCRVRITVGAKTRYAGPYAESHGARSLLTRLLREARGEVAPPTHRSYAALVAKPGEAVSGDVETLRDGKWVPLW